jgi:hypothetical protein
MSEAVKLHSPVATLGQQRAKPEAGRLGVLGYTHRHWFPRPQVYRRRMTVLMLTDSTHTEMSYSQMAHVANFAQTEF